MRTKLLVATHNPGKVQEYRELLADLPLDVTWLDAEGINFEAEETGNTFEANAILKATAYASAAGLLTWADDSGLEVDYLGGWPGVASARHAGPKATDQDRVRILLGRLAGVPYGQRSFAVWWRWPGLTAGFSPPMGPAAGSSPNSRREPTALAMIPSSSFPSTASPTPNWPLTTSTPSAIGAGRHDKHGSFWSTTW